MPEEKRPFWTKIFSNQETSDSEVKVLEYIVHRTNKGVDLHEVVNEEYVRRNATDSQIEDILCNPKLVHATRERLEKAFQSEELDPHRKPKR